jgi:FtsP/CotA-like multicopper oxidase with cupredoxin domain
MSNRRSFLQQVAGWSAGLIAAPQIAHAEQRTPAHTKSRLQSAVSVPVVTTDVGDLPYALDNGVKVFHLIAEPVKQRILPGKTLDLWGFNGSAPGPTIQVNRGDHVRVIFENRLPEQSTMHWHGFEDQLRYDGVPGISQPVVAPGAKFTYEFDIHQEGTFFYHSHMAMQEMNGMLGGFIMHPRESYTPHVAHDFLVNLQEYAVLPNNTVPNTMNMEFNWLTLNGKVGPDTTPLIARQGNRVRIRLVNMGMDHHPIHLHGNTWWTTGTEGGRIPQTAWMPGNTQLVGVGQARDVEFDAARAGDWMLHCHMPHHMMNQMVSVVGPMLRPGAMPHDMSAEIAPNANEVKGYPQDAMMESSMMAMDQQVARPENHGLATGWSGYMQGMMALVRVLPPAEYDAMLQRMRDAKRENDPYAAVLTGGAR